MRPETAIDRAESLCIKDVLRTAPAGNRRLISPWLDPRVLLTLCGSEKKIDEDGPRLVGTMQPEKFPEHSHDSSDLRVAGG
jgi:hypothetical protein